MFILNKPPLFSLITLRCFTSCAAEDISWQSKVNLMADNRLGLVLIMKLSKNNNKKHLSGQVMSLNNSCITHPPSPSPAPLLSPPCPPSQPVAHFLAFFKTMQRVESDLGVKLNFKWLYVGSLLYGVSWQERDGKRNTDMYLYKTAGGGYYIAEM